MAYCERMKCTFWPDWVECTTQGGTTTASRWNRLTQEKVEEGWVKDWVECSTESDTTTIRKGQVVPAQKRMVFAVRKTICSSCLSSVDAVCWKFWPSTAFLLLNPPPPPPCTKPIFSAAVKNETFINPKRATADGRNTCRCTDNASKRFRLCMQCQWNP